MEYRVTAWSPDGRAHEIINSSELLTVLRYIRAIPERFHIRFNFEGDHEHFESKQEID